MVHKNISASFSSTAYNADTMASVVAQHVPAAVPAYLLPACLPAEWAETYGDVFKWFWGPQPVICVRGERHQPQQQQEVQQQQATQACSVPASHSVQQRLLSAAQPAKLTV
jgi:hypothetical protein